MTSTMIAANAILRDESGCGPGRHVLALAERGVPVLGIDITERALFHARVHDFIVATGIVALVGWPGWRGYGRHPGTRQPVAAAAGQRP